MRVLLCALLLSSLCGCGTFSVNNPRWVQEAGYVSSKIGERNLFADTDQRPIAAIQYSLRAEAEVWRSEHFAVDLGLGPTAIFPLERYDGEAFGGKANARLLWKTRLISPYLFASQGWVWHEQAWDPNPVRYGFPTQFGLGIQKHLTEKGVSIGFEYRWWHDSWGSSKLGSDFRDFFGLGGDGNGPNPGHEGGGLFFSVSLPF